MDWVRVPANLTGVVAISAGGDFSLALKDDGTVVSWGNLLGLPFIGGLPQDLSDVRAISAGRSHAIALLDNGALVLWGNDTNGETRAPDGLLVVQPGSAPSQSLQVVVQASDGLLDDDAVITVNLTNRLPDEGDLQIPLSIRQEPGQQDLIFATWPSEVGKSYRVELSTNLLSWQTLESGIIGTGALESRRVPNLGDKVFVRVREE